MKIKQAAFALMFLLLSAIAMAQTNIPKFDLRPSGFVGPDSVNHYVVVPVAKASKADLYKKALSFVNSLYTNPQAVVSAVDGESITINATANRIKGKAVNAEYVVKYNIQIDFKNGRFRFEPKILDLKEYWPALEETNQYYVSNKNSSNPRELKAIWIVREDGPLLFHPDIKQSLDAWINGYVAGIVNKTVDNW